MSYDQFYNAWQNTLAGTGEINRNEAAGREFEG
jgi:hypothetical protein